MATIPRRSDESDEEKSRVPLESMVSEPSYPENMLHVASNGSPRQSRSNPHGSTYCPESAIALMKSNIVDDRVNRGRTPLLLHSERLGCEPCKCVANAIQFVD